MFQIILMWNSLIDYVNITIHSEKAFRMMSQTNFNTYLKYKTLEPAVFYFIINLSSFGIFLVVFLLWIKTDLSRKSFEVLVKKVDETGSFISATYFSVPRKWAHFSLDNEITYKASKYW